MTGADQDPLAFKVLNEIGVIAQLAGNRFTAVLPDGLSLPGFGVLNHFVRLGDGRTPLQLARAFQVSKPTMTNTLQRLEARGWIRSEPDAADGRSRRLYLTEAGRSARENAVAALAPTLAALDEAFDRGAFEALLPTLADLRAWLDRARD